MPELKLSFNEEKLKLNLPPTPTLNFSALSKGDIQRIVSAIETDLQDDFDLINQNIDTHTTDTEMHITADERALWSTVSDKANQLDIGDVSKLSVTSFASDVADNLVDAANLNNKCVFDMLTYIIGNKLLLPNPDETIVDNIVSLKGCIDANRDEMSETFHDRVVDVDTQINNMQSELEDLQTQMGDIETALDGIITIQNTLIGGDAV